MFSNAYKVVKEYTNPVVFSYKKVNGEVRSSIGTFIILNREGWVITAAHIIQPSFIADQNLRSIEEIHHQEALIMARTDISESKRKRELRNCRIDPNWISNYSYWWGKDGAVIQEFKLLLPADLAIGKLDNYDTATIKHFPIIKNPENMQVGTSLCKLGYPFHEIQTTYDGPTHHFALNSQGGFPRFPLEGIYTRNALIGKMDDGITDIKFLETSSPGLRGQSGGPIFDVNGVIWAIQSRTLHLPLGFSPSIEKNGKKVEENQFLNVGLGVHAETIVKFLRDNNVSFQLSEN
jgi:hypothetical protein